MKQYEYCIKKYDGKGFFGGKFELAEVEKEFNKMGMEGWELVSFMDTSAELGSTRWMVATFKRAKN